MDRLCNACNIQLEDDEVEYCAGCREELYDAYTEMNGDFGYDDEEEFQSDSGYYEEVQVDE